MKIDENKDEAIRLYNSGYTIKAVAEQLDCCAETAKRRLVEWGVTLVPKNMSQGSPMSRADFLSQIRSLGTQARVRNKTYVGSGNPRWKGGASDHYFKQNVFSKFGRRCFLCGYDEHPEIIEVHHKDHNHKNNNLENGIPVCPNCHRIEHFKHKTFNTKRK